MQKYFVSLALSVAALLLTVLPARAFTPGMHVLRPQEIENVVREFAPYRLENQPIYVTLPFALDDIHRLNDWQKAFVFAKQNNVIPLVRIATRFDQEQGAWEVPTKKNIIEISAALNRLNWPQETRHVILFNEPNHAKEWGGRIDPHEFARITDFALNWFGTEQAKYAVLPAGLDLAAPDGNNTKEALGYWREVLGSKPEILDKIAAWNSHSYPNPAFSAPPDRWGKNSLRGFTNELAFLKQFSDREWDVFITETGWDTSTRLEPKLKQYYLIAANKIWSHPQVKVVTPFIFAGSPGPFSGFSFFDETGKPTNQWKAFAAMLSQRGYISQAE